MISARQTKASFQLFSDSTSQWMPLLLAIHFSLSKLVTAFYRLRLLPYRTHLKTPLEAVIVSNGVSFLPYIQFTLYPASFPQITLSPAFSLSPLLPGTAFYRLPFLQPGL